MRITKKKIAGAVAVSAVVALGAGTAFAYWTSTGTGDGTALVGEDTALTIDSEQVSFLYPGATLDLTVTIENTNPYSVFLPNGVTGAAPTFTVAPVGSNVCDANNFQLIENAPGAITVAAAGVGAEYTYAVGAFQIHMLPKSDTNDLLQNQDGCKNATVTINYAAS